ncbi:MAG: methyltransferase domain-containing protein [Candidatus Marinimicrobia bacterium]|nr:methyltransferase domain-containing protein [Candidatus Neomarinimicrobiota bacterium]
MNRKSERQAFQDRFDYHPRYNDPNFSRSRRKVNHRLNAILEHVDVTGKSVLDLGCSGGFFSFSMAQRASSVVGVDADSELVETNNELAKSEGLDNLEFINGDISVELLKKLPPSDVVLFLSVFHHILTASQAYDWNDESGTVDPFQIIAAIRDRCEVFVFEIGLQNEGYEWSRRLPEMKNGADAWIRDKIFGPAFDVERIDTPTIQGLTAGIRKMIFRRLDFTKLPARILRKIFGLDPRDMRNIYVGTRKKQHGRA